MRSLFRFCCTLAVAMSFASPSLSDSKKLSLFNGKSTVRVHSNLALPQNAKEAFNSTFRHQEYYAAFAVSPSGAFFQLAQYNDIQSAYRDALKMCRALLIPGEEDCILYASILPEDFKKTNHVTLSKPTTDFYEVYKDQPGHKAFAINPRYSYVTRDLDSKRAAISRALQLCDAKAKAKTPNALKVEKCFVVVAE